MAQAEQLGSGPHAPLREALRFEINNQAAYVTDTDVRSSISSDATSTYSVGEQTLNPYFVPPTENPEEVSSSELPIQNPRNLSFLDSSIGHKPSVTLPELFSTEYRGTCPSDSNHSDNLKDSRLHYSGCVKISEREEYFATLSGSGKHIIELGLSSSTVYQGENPQAERESGEHNQNSHASGQATVRYQQIGEPL
ncbi:hypothetical protein VTL71DRAFT_11455 [Oculimacula yallundae]|uniref:Uncharacterized protein n=1 Tax=Oculimacula yallundae TaxID=86028 RepID=A0ABR4CQ41_9HELO